MEFRIKTDTRTGKPMVEVWRDGEFIAGIYVHEDGMLIVSKYLDSVEHEADMPPSIVIKFSSPYKGEEKERRPFTAGQQ